MFTTLEAVLQPNGDLKFLEPVHLEKPQRVLVTFTSPIDESFSGLALSEITLATDWLRDEEDTAWAHLQPAK
ncbi:MAG: hypothetical protein ACFCUJ_08290 [Thiotrichales bacterium]